MLIFLRFIRPTFAELKKLYIHATRQYRFWFNESRTVVL